jgi:hypothetical protein
MTTQCAYRRNSEQDKKTKCRPHRRCHQPQHPLPHRSSHKVHSTLQKQYKRREDGRYHWPKRAKRPRDVDRRIEKHEFPGQHMKTKKILRHLQGQSPNRQFPTLLHNLRRHINSSSAPSLQDSDFCVIRTKTPAAALLIAKARERGQSWREA